MRRTDNSLTHRAHMSAMGATRNVEKDEDCRFGDVERPDWISFLPLTQISLSNPSRSFDVGM
jgi:hypothetical protein